MGVKRMWHFGDKDAQIRPFRQLRSKWDVQPCHRMRYTRAKAVMEFFEQIASELPVTESSPAPPAIASMSIHESDSIFARIYEIMLAKLYPKAPPRHHEQVTCGTLYNKLCRLNKTQP